MLRPRDWVLISGLAVMCLGYECLPHGQQANAKNNLSLFAQSSGEGAFLSVGAGMLVAGLLIVALSFLLPRR